MECHINCYKPWIHGCPAVGKLPRNDLHREIDKAKDVKGVCGCDYFGM